VAPGESLFLLATKMHYYKRHIGDYAKKAGHFSPLEHGVYIMIVDGYYDREHAPTLLEATRWARARTEEEKAAVLAVLDELFTLDEDRYHLEDVDQAIMAYQSMSETNRVIAVQREEQKRARMMNGNSTERAQSVHDDSTLIAPNHKPLTTNQKTVDKVKPIVPAKAVTASGEAQTVFAYWQEKRGYGKAKLDAKRLKAITSRLKDGYSVEDLCKAIDGIARSPHHMGENDRRTMYDDIELICRDGPKVDNFMKLAGAVPGLSPRLQHQVDVLNEWMSKP
jgi:uncharacterized protein YdaU (DUF1376 family)